jgi:hypothetical protein
MAPFLIPTLSLLGALFADRPISGTAPPARPTRFGATAVSLFPTGAAPAGGPPYRSQDGRVEVIWPWVAHGQGAALGALLEALDRDGWWTDAVVFAPGTTGAVWQIAALRKDSGLLWDPPQVRFRAFPTQVPVVDEPYYTEIIQAQERVRAGLEGLRFGQAIR